MEGDAPQDRIPLEAIGRILSECMDAAVKNGANSVSMPDHYVEVAVWLDEMQRLPVAGNN